MRETSRPPGRLVAAAIGRRLIEVNRPLLGVEVRHNPCEKQIPKLIQPGGLLMKKLTMIASVAALGLVMGACTPREERVASGALIGAAAGGLIGAAATGRGGGALAGAAIGAAGGAIIADATRPQRECVRVRYNRYGEAVCTRWARTY
jgi:osmotically inducible lipoprotein OsmB